MMSEHTLAQPPLPERAVNVERWGWYSIGVNVVLAAINLTIAFASGSLAVEVVRGRSTSSVMPRWRWKRPRR